MTKRIATMSLVVLMLAGSSLDAHAQKKKTRAKPSSAPSTTDTSGGTITQFAKQTNYDFDDDLVNGDLVRPDGEQLVVRRRGERRSLVRLREHFIPEMLKSVEDL